MKSFTFVYSNISSALGFVLFESIIQSASEVFSISSFGISFTISSTSTAFSSSTSVLSILVLPSITFVNLIPKVLKSSSLNKVFTASLSTPSLNSFSGNLKSIGASRRIVANILLNSASSLPSFNNFIIRSVIPIFLKDLYSSFLSLSNFLYISSIVPKFEMRVLAVFSPIPFIPTILSEGSPLNPL